MLHRASEMGDDPEHQLPIVSICVLADKNKAPTSFIVKTHDDATDADLWKDGFGFGIFNRVVRYIAISRTPSQSHCVEVITDLAIISEKEAVPSNFVCIDFTADTKEKALKKKYLCARFTPRNDTLDALSELIILGRSKRPPKGFTSAGDNTEKIPPLYPALAHSDSFRHSTSDLDQTHEGSNAFTLKAGNRTFKGIDGIPFTLNPLYSSNLANNRIQEISEIPDLKLQENYNYNFSLERSIIT